MTLKQEADLLGRMIKFVEDTETKGLTTQAEVIQRSWARFLGERKLSNETLAKTGDAELLADLTEELAQVQCYIGETRTHPDYTETWEVFLKCERDILEALIRKINDEKAAD
jgi:hypothetical protein